MNKYKLKKDIGHVFEFVDDKVVLFLGDLINLYVVNNTKLSCWKRAYDMIDTMYEYFVECHKSTLNEEEKKTRKNILKYVKKINRETTIN